jgi:hypothetical protein
MLSTTLNDALPIQDVLRECGTAVNTVPGVCKCPVCGQNSLYVTRLANEAGGWYQCLGHRFEGDSLSLLAERNQRPLEEFIRSRKMQNTALFTPLNISKHVETVRKRQAMREAWYKISSSSALFQPETQELAALMADMRILRHTDMPFWDDSPLARVVGGCTGRSAREILPTAGLNPFPGTKNQPWIVTPIYSAPGLITGFAGIGQEDIEANHFPDHDNNDGLLFLHRPRRAGEDIAYAFGSARHALALYIMAQQNLAREMPPVIAYTETSDTAWRHVLCRKVIFWAPQIDLDLFIQARHVGDRAHIARLPLPDDGHDPFEHYRGLTYGMVLHRLERVAVPWLLALKDYIVATARSAVADSIPLKLSLGPSELERLYSYCATQEERRIFNAVYESGPIDITVTLPGKGTKLIQKATGWYRVARHEHVLLTDAMPVVESQTDIDGKEDNALLSGHIRIGGKTGVVPFRVRRGDFNARWLRETCNAAGHFVTVAADNLLAVAEAFHRPTMLAGLKKIGWDEDRAAFVFANVSLLHNGQLDETPRMAPLPHPSDRFQALTPVRPELIEDWFADAKYANFWRVWLGGLYNVLAPANALPTIPVGVHCPGGEDVVMEAARALYGEYADPADPDTVRVKAEANNLPVWVGRHPAAPLAAGVIKTIGMTNVILDLADEENAHLAQLMGWHIISCQGPVEVPEQAHLLLGAALTQQQRDPAPADLPPFRFALETVKRFCARAFEHKAQGLNGILRFVSAPDATPAGEGARLLGVIRLLIRERELPVQAGMAKIDDALPSKTHAVLADGSICVPLDGLARALARTRLPYGVPVEATEWLAATGMLQTTYTSLGSVAGWRLDNKALGADG